MASGVRIDSLTNSSKWLPEVTSNAVSLRTLRSVFETCNTVFISQPGHEFSIVGRISKNDDHNPQRIQPRNLFDVALGHDNIFHGDRYKVSARLEVINLTDKVTLYNFLSTFSGTHYVSPRTVTGTIGFHF